MNKSPHIGEIGRSIETDCGENISSATDQYFLVMKPSGVVVSWAASKFEINGVVQGLRYVTVAGDLNEAGVYKIHPFLTIGDWTGPASDVISLPVRALFS